MIIVNIYDNISVNIYDNDLGLLPPAITVPMAYAMHCILEDTVMNVIHCFFPHSSKYCTTKRHKMNCNNVFCKEEEKLKLKAFFYTQNVQKIFSAAAQCCRSGCDECTKCPITVTFKGPSFCYSSSSKSLLSLEIQIQIQI